MMKWADVLTIISGKNQKEVSAPNGKYPIYGSGGIMGRATAFLCEAGTTIVGRKGTINRPIYVDEPFWNVDTAFGIQPGEKLLPKYLFYFCQSFNFKSLDKSTTIPSLAKTDLLNIEMPVPTLPEQQRIVARIEELFSQLDSGMETLRKTKQQLVVYRQAVLKEAFEGRLTGSLPIGEGTIGEFIETPRYGTAKKCSYSESVGSVDVYRIPNINYSLGRIDHTDIKRAAFSDSELDGIQLQPDDILIIRSNGSVSLVGRAALVREADTGATFAGYLMRLRIKDKILLLPKFLLLYLQSHSARLYIENKAKSTSGVHNINSKEIAALQIPIFDHEDQKKITEAIEARLSVCDSIEQTVDSTLRQAEALRQSILKQAFEGGLYHVEK